MEIILSSVIFVYVVKSYQKEAINLEMLKASASRFYFLSTMTMVEEQNHSRSE